jgi:hypothetical protein
VIGENGQAETMVSAAILNEMKGLAMQKGEWITKWGGTVVFDPYGYPLPGVYYAAFSGA